MFWNPRKLQGYKTIENTTSPPLLFWNPQKITRVQNVKSLEDELDRVLEPSQSIKAQKPKVLLPIDGNPTVKAMGSTAGFDKPSIIHKAQNKRYTILNSQWIVSSVGRACGC